LSDNFAAREAIIQAVENQLEANDPPLVRVTLNRLVNSGLSRSEAIKHIAGALVIEIDGALHKSEAFNAKRYDQNLEKLPNPDWNSE